MHFFIRYPKEYSVVFRFLSFTVGMLDIKLMRLNINPFKLIFEVHPTMIGFSGAYQPTYKALNRTNKLGLGIVELEWWLKISDKEAKSKGDK